MLEFAHFHAISPWDGEMARGRGSFSTTEHLDFRGETQGIQQFCRQNRRLGYPCVSPLFLMFS
jgi:hypothetical protein